MRTHLNNVYRNKANQIIKDPKRYYPDYDRIELGPVLISLPGVSLSPKIWKMWGIVGVYGVKYDDYDDLGRC